VQYKEAVLDREREDGYRAKQRQYYKEHREEIIAKVRAWQVKNKEHRREYMRRYAQANKEKLRSNNKEWLAAHPGRDSDYHLVYRYGTKLTVYQEMLAAQRGRCAICGEEPGRRRFHLDHDHTSGAVRGLLCGPCNHLLGNCRDDPAILRWVLLRSRSDRPGDLETVGAAPTGYR
jgi:hypothetical protein